MQKQNTLLLKQLILSLEEAEEELEQAYDKKDVEKLNKTKKFILQTQEKISEILSQ